MARLDRPIASPSNSPLINAALTNGTFAITPDGIIHYLLRGWGKEGTNLISIDRNISNRAWNLTRNEGYSYLFYTQGRRGNPFSLEDISEEPVLLAEAGEFDSEDARITHIHKTDWYAIFTTTTGPSTKPNGHPNVGYSPALYFTKDFNTYYRTSANHKTGLWKFTKDWVLFSEQVTDPYNNKAHAALFSTRVPKEFAQVREVRRYYRKAPGIWIAYSKDLVNWYGHREILRPQRKESHLGPGSTPIKTKYGWCHFIHAVKIEDPSQPGTAYMDLGDFLKMNGEEQKKKIRVYTPQMILLDTNRPDHCTYVTDDLAQPKDWEINTKTGLKHFMITQAMECILANRRVFAATYGAGDKHTGAVIIDPAYLRGSMYKVPTERIPIPKP